MARSIFLLNLPIKQQRLTLNYRLTQCFSTKDGSGGENNTPKQETESSTLETNSDAKAKPGILSRQEVKENAKKKLFSLLSELKIDPENLNKTHSNLNLAKAVKRPMKKERFKDMLEQRQKTPESEIENAAKVVAENLPGDPKETLSKLNEKLRILNLTKEPPMPIEDMEEDNVDINEKIGQSLLEEEGNKNIMSSVEEVAAAVTDSPINVSSLSQRLLRLSVESESTATPKKSLDDLMKSMKVDTRRGQTRKEGREMEERPAPIQRKQAHRSFAEAQFNIFQAPPLDLPIQADTTVDGKKTVWQRLEENRLRLLVQFAPTNGFEEMIMWTEQGKHWKFPIDNETEMGAEENVGFNEHVFLEEHLHGFPTKGPIRHFMDLVVVGLSQNPYITVERKIENINWFRDYFMEKEEILKECGALG